MALNLTTGETAGISFVNVHGEVDVSCADELRTCIHRVMEHESKGIRIDIADMPYIDSTGIGVLVGAAHAAAEQGITFEIAHPQRNVARVLELLGVTSDLGIVQD
ncbi:MAG: STAS domain-containing protein [Atopobiaceae bacterium]|jgi:anti-anti-sigma factor|nr:STAS domain-containing protein [Atopobiaceae bacterium]